MTPVEELKLIAKKHRWAFQELTYSEHLLTANKITSRKSYPRDEEEKLYDDAEKQAQQFFSSPNQMYSYLRTAYGSQQEVLETLRWLIITQKARRKTLHLVK